MKIAYLLGSLNRGGTETLLLDVFRHAASSQLDAIGVYRKTGVCEQDFREAGIPLFQRQPSNNMIAYLVSLRRLLKSQQVEVVHAQQAIDALYAYLALMGTGIKIVLSTHGFDYTDSTTGKMILRLILRRTDRNIYVSSFQKAYYTKKYRLRAEKQGVVYNGIAFGKLDNDITHRVTLSHPVSSEAVTQSHPVSADSNSLRKELQLPDTTLLLGMVGNFNRVRDQHTVCRFLNLLHQSGIAFHFVFAGKRIDALGERYDACVDYCNRNNLSDKVSFLGVRHDVPQILQGLDAFVYATDHDTFGIAVVEAMAVGLPVFVNDWDVMTEITENGKLATLYKTGDEADLYTQFSLFLQNRALYAEKAVQAAGVVRQKYSIEKHIAGLKEVYERVGKLES